ncbi:hypothetical protein QBL02_01035 [Leucobacter sp. UT-8R-CII-1-4]|uniref:DUF11 domain-containing protein n=1 Tax=Leucobacter sp. UT-8R-CII-1-4 TaxID=3040075 RepID=UPI0024A8C944|nr:hypothetical protein [Leucobacter sp. UT-8R-CII-1-4]MDI6022122.1 hypothetical protein [Leucobacter sp. UT-8R-CII-1-4]
MLIHSRRLSHRQSGSKQSVARWGVARGFGAITLVAALTFAPAAVAFADDAPVESSLPAASEALEPTASAPKAEPIAPVEVVPEAAPEAPPEATPAAGVTEEAVVPEQAGSEAADSVPAETPASVTVASAPIGATAASNARAQAPSGDNAKKDDQPLDHVWICHALGKGNGGYNLIYPANMGVLEGHVGSHHQQGRDIIPPIPQYGFAGQNWNSETQAIYENSCNEPEAPTPVVSEASVDQCTTVSDSLPATVDVSLASLVEGNSYRVTVTKNSVLVDSEDVSASGATAMVELGLNGSGEYLVTVTDLDTQQSSSLEFTVFPCPTPLDFPTAGLIATPCTEIGQVAPTAATLEMQGLIIGVNYTAVVTNSSEEIVLEYEFTATAAVASAPVTLDGAGTYEITLSDDTHEASYGPFESEIEPCPASLFDLSIVKTATAKEGGVWSGDTIHYSLTVANAGPAAAPDPVVTDLLPAGLTLGDIVDLDGWTVQSSDSGSLTLAYDGNFLAGSSSTIVFEASVGMPLNGDAEPSEVVNTACVDTAPQEVELLRVVTPADSNSENNCSSATTPVTPPAVVPVPVTPTATPVHVTKPVPSPLAVTGNERNDDLPLALAAAFLFLGIGATALGHRESRRMSKRR